MDIINCSYFLNFFSIISRFRRVSQAVDALEKIHEEVGSIKISVHCCQWSIVLASI